MCNCEWKDIETAPTGAHGYAWMYLAWGPEDDPTTGSGMRYGDKFFASETFFQAGQEQAFALRINEVKPHHWRPLPPPPKEAP